MKKAMLTEKQIRYAISQCRKGRSTTDIASEPGVGRRRIQQLYAEFNRTGRHHVRCRPGRRHAMPTPEDTAHVPKAHKEEPAGAMRAARHLRAARNITYWQACRIMKDSGLVASSAAKSRRRKWVRYERRYPDAMRRTDWHATRDPRFRGLRPVACPDGAPGCVAAARIFTQAASENAVPALREAMRRSGTPATILSDDGSCFVGRGGRRKAALEPWTPTTSGAGPLDRGTGPISSGPHHPQTNGKLERFHKSIEDETFHYGSLSAYIEYYDERRLRFSPDMDNCQTPLGAFAGKKAAKAIRKSNPKWMEEDANDYS